MACIVGESPLWCARRALWYWVDIAVRMIWRFDPATGAARSWQTEEMAACIALADDGGLVAGMQSGLFHLRLDEGGGSVEAKLLAAPAESMAGMRFNDGRCDRQGRFWSGTMALDMTLPPASGNLYRYSAAHGISAPT